MMNDPALEVCNEVRTLRGHAMKLKGMLVSVGPGVAGEHRKSTSRLRSSKLMKYTFAGVTPGSTQSEKTQDPLIDRYYRLAVPRTGLDLKAEVELEDVLSSLELSALDTKLNQCAENLVQRRRERCQTSRWEAFAVGARYQCPEPDCLKGFVMYHARDELLIHLMREHLHPDSLHREPIDAILDRGRKIPQFP